VASSFWYLLNAAGNQCVPSMCLRHIDGARRGLRPVSPRALWAMKRGGSVVSKGVEQAAAPLRDYCEPDRPGLRPFIFP